MPKLTFHGHATCSLETEDGVHLVIDPFFGDNPACDVSVADVEADFILITHGHYDHVADAVALAERTGATVIATFEIASYMESKGLTASPQHIGGGVSYPFGYVKLTAALHGGVLNLPGGEASTSLPAGLLIHFSGGQRFHHAGDTALLMDMQLLKGQVDVAMLPIGDRFTMGPADAVRAVEFIEPKVVIPIHYDTWPPIEQDAEAFKAAVGDRAEVEIMAPGDTYAF
jgi:L-ascorbate metabolism protein UlaG (beta-lactamase superfamily)